MTNLRALSLLVLASSVGLTGCFRTTQRVQKVQAPTVYRTASVSQLEKEVSDRDNAIHTLDASVLITASTGGGKEGQVTTYTAFRGYIFVQKPRDLRVILQLPVIGSRALDMVSNGANFKLLIPPKNKAILGTNEVTKPSRNGLENLRPAVFFDSLLVPGVGDDEFVSLTESTRVLQPETRHHDAIEEPDYDLAVLKKTAGNVMRLERLVHFSRVTMLPFQQDIFDDGGQVVTQATYENYQESSGQPFPTLIMIKRPLDEYTLKVQITKLTLNETFPSDQFELTIPPNVTVQNMP